MSRPRAPETDSRHTLIGGSGRWRNLGIAAGAVTSVLFAAFDLYQWAAAYAADHFHNDFTFYFAAARIGLAHGWSSIYDLGIQQSQLDAMGSGIKIAELARYISPPPVAWLAVPFTVLPYPVAYWAWSAVLVAALGLVWYFAAPDAGRARVVLLAAAVGWLPVIYGLQLAQPGLLVALGVAGSYVSVPAVFIIGTAAGGGTSRTISRGDRQSGSNSGGRVLSGGNPDAVMGGTRGRTVGR